MMANRPHWRADLHRFANDALRSFAERDDVAGVALGGSLARGLEWKYSDVELAILVDRRLEEFGHFAVRDGRRAAGARPGVPAAPCRVGQGA